MPEEKKDSKPKKAVKKTAKAEKVKSPAKSTKKAKIKKEVVEVVETLANEVIDNQIEESPVNEPTAEEFLKDLKIPDHKVWAMPAGDDRESLKESYGPVMNFVRDRGWRFTGRAHIMAFDTEREV